MPVNAVFGDVDKVQYVVFRVPKRAFAQVKHHRVFGRQLLDRCPVVIHGAPTRRDHQTKEKTHNRLVIETRRLRVIYFIYLLIYLFI